MNGQTTQTNLQVTEIQASITRAVEEFASFISILQKRFASQLPHSIFNSVALVGFENIPKHILRLAIISAIGEYLNWEVEEVRGFQRSLPRQADP